MQKFKLHSSAVLAAILLLAAAFQSCSPQYKQDYEKKCLELDVKKKQLDYLRDLYSVKSDIEFEYKIKKLDSLINEAARLK